MDEKNSFALIQEANEKTKVRDIIAKARTLSAENARVVYEELSRIVFEHGRNKP